MASKFVSSNVVTLVLSLSLVAISTCMEIVTTNSLQSQKQLKQTNFVFYMHDREPGDSVTTVPIAGIRPVKKWFLGRFGTTFVIDDLLTETPDRSSPTVGHARGIYVNSAVAGTDIHFLFSLVFTNKEFNGSSLEIQGANEILRRFREVSVASGTGMFRFARGYAIFDNYFVDMKAFNAILRWNVTVLHY